MIGVLIDKCMSKFSKFIASYVIFLKLGFLIYILVFDIIEFVICKDRATRGWSNSSSLINIVKYLLNQSC